MREVWESTPSDNTLDRMLYYDWHYTLADNDLRKVETMCALAGVRVSYPMLHADVVDMSTRVPANVKMPGTRLRDYYKQAVRGYLPDEIIHKKKHGFGLPFGFWLKDSPQLRDLIFGNLAQFRTRNIVRPQFIDRLLDLHRDEDARHYGVFLWVIAMLEQWFQEHRLSPTI
jgi:asparagine synthase (glutamine-hydrolysing)